MGRQNGRETEQWESCRMIGVFLSLERLQVLEVHLRDWLSRPDNQAKKDINGELSDIWP
jgi:hypothetical protein